MALGENLVRLLRLVPVVARREAGAEGRAGRADAVLRSRSRFARQRASRFASRGRLSSARGAVAAIGAERIVHNPLTGDLHWDADGAGGVGPVRFANIGAGTVLLNYDFFVN